MARIRISTISKCKNRFQLGYLLILLSALFAALIHVLAKPLLDNQGGFEIHPVVLTACIYLINAAFFTPLTRRSQPILSLGKRNLSLLAIIGVAEVIALITYFFGLKESTAANASIFSNGEIVFSLLIVMVIFKENLQRRELTPFVMLILGMMVIPVGYDFYLHGMVLSDLVVGDLLIIMSGSFYALDVMLCRYLSDKVDAKRITQVTSLISGVCAVAALAAFHIPFEVEPMSLGPIAFFAVGGTGLATMLFLVSLRLIGGVRTILLFSTNSVMGVILAVVLLGETITVVNMISVALTFGGIYLLRNRLGETQEDPPTKSEEIQKQGPYELQKQKPVPRQKPDLIPLSRFSELNNH